MGGGRGFGGMRGGGSQHQMTRSTGRTNQSSGRTGRDTSTNHNVNNLGANKTGNFSGTKTTNTQSNVNNSTLNASGANTGTKTTTRREPTAILPRTRPAPIPAQERRPRMRPAIPLPRTCRTPMPARRQQTPKGPAEIPLRNTSITNTGSKEGSSPGTPGNSTSTTPGDRLGHEWDRDCRQRRHEYSDPPRGWRPHSRLADA